VLEVSGGFGDGAGPASATRGVLARRRAGARAGQETAPRGRIRCDRRADHRALSRTAGARYLSNGCHRCAALFGAYYLAEQILMLAANSGALDDFRPLATGPVETARWSGLIAARTAVLG
jgi:hypothetical protein